MKIAAKLPKNAKKITISGSNNLFSQIYLTPLLHQSGVFWLCFKNDYQLKRGYDLLNWWYKKNNKQSVDIITWFTNQALSPADIYKLIYSKKAIIFTVPTNLRQKIIDLEYFKKQILVISQGDEYNLSNFKKQLVLSGYRLNNLADQPGLLASRGFILDIWSAQHRQPHRIEFDGNVINKISMLNPITKKTGVKKDNLSIIPIDLNIKHKQNLNNIINEQHKLLISDDLFEESKGLASFNWQQLYLLQAFHDKQSLNCLQSTPLFHSNFRLLKQYIKDNKNNDIYFITENINKIKSLCKEKNIKPKGVYEFKPFLFHGLRNLVDNQIYLTDADIFKVETPSAIKVAKKHFALDIKINNYVVHRDHGIAKFTKMTTQIIDGIEREYFVLEYKDNDKLYLPVERVDKISKYLGVSKPKLHRLGAASTWPQIIRKVKEDIVQTAQELLNLYARRQLSRAKPLMPHHEEENKLAADFHYEETPDQIKALTETLNDLAQDKPTDRLICGDVGFGKTEIAIRAAWRAALNGQQTVLLCPTTILAQQHFDTFSTRFKNYPVKVALLSRFIDSKKQIQTIKQITAGQIDVIIGTHRLLSKDVKFKQIGLIIIDEEQQFGVKDKEKLKDLKTSAHILSLSATPIPRTLNLSLSSVRDISIISTPPVGRLPIKTYIKRFSEQTIVDVIKNEVKRQGQVYYLYNKVATINEQLKFLKILLPNYKYAVVHGQLSNRQIAQTMHQFDIGKIDVLVCSTIIANGLDLPNVNSLIVDGAQNFGLAQLYQIRGRIGRSHKQAYAYFLYHSTKLKGKAAQRLQILQAAETLGAGFQIAVRDMELRGIGNILGKKQHGKISLVGLSLYNELIAQTISEIKNDLIPTPLINTIINLPFTIGLPRKFLTNEVSRLKYYQSLASSETIEQLNKHFNKLPQPWPQSVKNLKHVLELKILAQQAGIVSIESKRFRHNDELTTKIYITFNKELDYKKVSELLRINPAWEYKKNQLKINKDKLGNKWIYQLKETLLLFK